VEISERSLRALVAATDDQHRASLDSLPDDIRALHGATRRFRRFAIPSAAVAVIGTQVVPISGLVPRAMAADGDAGIAAFAESVELTAVAAYTAAAQSGLVTTAAVLDAATVFSGHHSQHAAAFASAAGAAATGTLNKALLDALTPGLMAAKTEADVVKLAFDLENAAAATYLFAIGALESKEALQLTAAILPVEAQHAVVLGQVIGADVELTLPAFQSQNGFVDPAKFPVG
jgi:Ferritin-like domain